MNHNRSKFRDDQNKQHLIDTLISYAEKPKKEALVSIPKYIKENKVNTYIDLSCRNSLKNKSPTKQTFEDEHSTRTKRACRRSKIQKFDFTKQCFYCRKVCFFDSKHPDRNPFQIVATNHTDPYYTTLELCKSCKDNAKIDSIERRLSRYLCFAVFILKRFQDICN